MFFRRQFPPGNARLPCVTCLASMTADFEIPSSFDIFVHRPGCLSQATTTLGSIPFHVSSPVRCSGYTQRLTTITLAQDSHQGGRISLFKHTSHFVLSVFDCRPTKCAPVRTHTHTHTGTKTNTRIHTHTPAHTPPLAHTLDTRRNNRNHTQPAGDTWRNLDSHRSLAVIYPIGTDTPFYSL